MCARFSVFVSGYVQCGSGLSTCILVTEKCDGVGDCLDMWDERDSKCYRPEERSRFVQPSEKSISEIFYLHASTWTCINTF